MKVLRFDEKEFAERMKGTGADRFQDWLFFRMREVSSRYATRVDTLNDGSAALVLEYSGDTTKDREAFLLVYMVLEDIGRLMEFEEVGAIKETGKMTNKATHRRTK